MPTTRVLEALRTLTPRSPSFAAGGPIPERCSCEGSDVAPALEWGPLPPGTRSLALVVDDPDAPRGVFTHWLAWDLPVEIPGLAEGEDVTAVGAREGLNDFADVGYRGPCPPSGTHRYFFKVFALDRALGLPRAAPRDAVERAMDGHVLAWGEVMGTYSR